MLMPKRVKRRKQHRGRMKGIATKGNYVAYGTYTEHTDLQLTAVAGSILSRSRLPV